MKSREQKRGSKEEEGRTDQEERKSRRGNHRKKIMEGRESGESGAVSAGALG